MSVAVKGLRDSLSSAITGSGFGFSRTCAGHGKEDRACGWDHAKCTRSIRGPAERRQLQSLGSTQLRFVRAALFRLQLTDDEGCLGDGRVDQQHDDEPQRQHDGDNHRNNPRLAFLDVAESRRWGRLLRSRRPAA